MIKPMRLTWTNAMPASVKQVEFVRSLVYKMKSERPAASTLKEPDRMLWELWEYAEVPDDLTKLEATCLIDLLRYTGWNSPMLASGTAMALLKYFEGGSFSASKDAHVFMLVISDCQSIIDAIEPARIEAALLIRQERAERAKAEKCVTS
jgi:hypothetical protein